MNPQEHLVLLPFKTSWQMNPQAARLLGESLSYPSLSGPRGEACLFGLLVHLS